MDAIAPHCGLSRSALQWRFHKVLDRSIHQEIILNKIKRARELLTRANLPLAWPSAPVFKHQEYMGRVQDASKDGFSQPRLLPPPASD